MTASAADIQGQAAESVTRTGRDQGGTAATEGAHEMPAKTTLFIRVSLHGRSGLARILTGTITRQLASKWPAKSGNAEKSGDCLISRAMDKHDRKLS